MSHTCATCRHFRPLPGRDGKPESTGPCWRYPPTDSDINVSVEDGCGEHAPRPDEAGPGLPAGWEWRDVGDDTCAAETGRGLGFARLYADEGMTSASAPIDVVLAVIARARVGGAS